MYIKVKVKTNSDEELFEKVSDTSFKIQVKEKAERNLANTRVIELLRRHFGPKAGQIRIVNGHHSPSKLVAVGD
ncbi:MAG: DUF167 domain-containing protein [Candidatus Paceibacterota bacterium]|jgi:uncharacterized protein YggU (UPF0235/DUF167 family)